MQQEVSVSITQAPRQVAENRLQTWLERPVVQRSLIALVLINALILGLETNTALMNAWGGWLTFADRVILGLFVVEIALRIAASRLAYFRDPWNVFDFLVVGIALLPAAGPLAVLRALRVLRVFRLITLLPSMKQVVGGLLAALPGLGAVCAVIALIFYVAAVVATRLYGAEFPQWFGTLGESTFTLFQIMTLESWAMGIVRPLMEVFPMAWIFFLIFIVASTFTLLNLFIAVIVNAIGQEHASEAAASAAANGAANATTCAPQAPSEQSMLRQDIAALREQLLKLEAAARVPAAMKARRRRGSLRPLHRHQR